MARELIFHRSFLLTYMTETKSILKAVIDAIDSGRVEWITDPDNYDAQLGIYRVGNYMISKEMLGDIISNTEHYRKFLA